MSINKLNLEDIRSFEAQIVAKRDRGKISSYHATLPKATIETLKAKDGDQERPVQGGDILKLAIIGVVAAPPAPEPKNDIHQTHFKETPIGAVIEEASKMETDAREKGLQEAHKRGNWSIKKRKTRKGKGKISKKGRGKGRKK
jgi:hypothetical protein